MRPKFWGRNVIKKSDFSASMKMTVLPHDDDDDNESAGD